jgi:uncharacterized surface protein with fasciclin (FAS1) repeats
VFSTLNLALVKTGLIDSVNRKELHIGGTLFAPTNQAFAKLPPAVNAFLFSPAGEKYLKALLKYHIVPGHTLFTDAYYEPRTEDAVNDDAVIDKDHVIPSPLPRYNMYKSLTLNSLSSLLFSTPSQSASTSATSTV